MSVDAGSDDRQEPQFGKALYDIIASSNEEVSFLLSLSLFVCNLEGLGGTVWWCF